MTRLSPWAVASLSSYASAHSAEHAETPGAWKIASRTPASSTPLRITEMPWWIGAHEEVNFAGIEATRVRSASNCLGCHGSGSGDGPPPLARSASMSRSSQAMSRSVDSMVCSMSERA